MKKKNTKPFFFLAIDHQRLNSQDDQRLNIRYNEWSIGQHTTTNIALPIIQ